jgi:hypothetical protein
LLRKTAEKPGRAGQLPAGRLETLQDDQKLCRTTRNSAGRPFSFAGQRKTQQDAEKTYRTAKILTGRTTTGFLRRTILKKLPQVNFDIKKSEISRK